MRSSFIELVVKRRLAGQPPAPSNLRKRFQPVDAFKEYVYQVVPKMEQSVEIELLKKQLARISSKSVRNQLVSAYLNRFFKIRRHEDEQIASFQNDKLGSSAPQIRLSDPTTLKKVTQHTNYDVGTYVQFPSSDISKIFKSGCYGNYDKRQFAHTKKFGLLVRKQSVAINQIIQLLDQARTQPVDWAMFRTMQAEQIAQYVDDEHNYPKLFSALSNQCYQYVQKFKTSPNYLRTWGTSVVSDGLINSILQHSPTLKTDPVGKLKQAIEFVQGLQVPLSPGDFSKRIKSLPLETPIPVKTTVPKYASFYFSSPSFKSIFLGGNGGSGKSMILAYATMLAHYKDWLVINVPSGYNWTNDRKATPVRAFNGLFLIYDHAVDWLIAFRSANGHLLDKILVQQSLYGRCDVTGCRPGLQVQPVPNRFDQRRQVYFNEIAEKMKNRIQDLDWQKQALKRMTDVYPKIKSLEELISKGIQNPEYSICAMGQLLKQLYASQHPILECVDGFSFFYRPSWYKSFRYFNDRGLHGQIPPYHIAHCRLFMSLDGHKIKNGLKLVASSNEPLYKHKFDIKQIMLPESNSLS